MRIKYFATDVAVMPGDQVRFRNWFRLRDALIVHVPGISPKHKDFSDGPVPEVGLQSEQGYIYGIYVDPETGYLKKTVSFRERGTLDGFVLPETLDDPVETKGQ